MLMPRLYSKYDLAVGFHYEKGCWYSETGFPVWLLELVWSRDTAVPSLLSVWHSEELRRYQARGAAGLVKTGRGVYIASSQLSVDLGDEGTVGRWGLFHKVTCDAGRFAALKF